MPERREKSLWMWLAVALVLGAAVVPARAAAVDRPDLIVADFEGGDYAGWLAAGTAFGARPANGTLPGQMAVTGFLGHGLVNSFVGGDESTGTLTSPPWVVERPYLNFLIGGGGHPGKTCIDLLVDGKVVRTAGGPNTTPGGTEQLDWASWAVAALVGKTVVLRVVDDEKGGWGHINVDQITQSDRRRGLAPARRELVAASRYLHLPVDRDSPSRRLKISAAGRVVREFDIKLATGGGGFQVFLDLEPFHGQTLALETQLPADSQALERVTLGDQVPDATSLYREPRRPAFHFTSRRGWLNDPNGLVFYQGEYHLFYQHNPYGWDWGNMHWGHAVSPDLVHWTELPIALYPRAYGDWAFSGSAVVDDRNTSGFGLNGSPPLVLAYTSTARGECIAYSNDRGRSWREYEGNPVVRHQGRDPRLLWHAPSNRWVMAVYDEADGGRSIAFHSSPDLKTWKFESRIAGFFECPDLFELPVADAPGQSRWVLLGADGEYRLGNFDGHGFTPLTGKLRVWHGNFYASQTFSNAPRDRRVQIGWANGIDFPGQSFNQQMTVPCELTLRPTPDGPRLFAMPVAEIAALRGRTHRFNGLGRRPCNFQLPGLSGDLFDIDAEAAVGENAQFSIEIAGMEVHFDAATKTISVGDLKVPLAAPTGVVRLRILVDRGSIEVFGNDGLVAISRPMTTFDAKRPVSVAIPATASDVSFRTLEVHELESAWKRAPAAANDRVQGSTRPAAVSAQ